MSIQTYGSNLYILANQFPDASKHFRTFIPIRADCATYVYYFCGRTQFEDVRYTIAHTKVSHAWFEANDFRKRIPLNASKETGEKTILRGISGMVSPGEILAMLGPSGSGKTTLLSAIGGRIKNGRGHLSGKILYNEIPYTKELKRRTGFVSQDDVLYDNLTVSETLLYAANLRLPQELTKEEKVARVEAVIEELGLQKCKDTRLGGGSGYFSRGVSGGERKRVSIGHEMLMNPSLLLLDEPTSGLDSTISLKIIRTLKNLASCGTTVITTTRQPSSLFFHLFNKILLLSDGCALYYGQRSDAMSYFESLGFTPTFATNPADFLLDLANGEYFPHKHQSVLLRRLTEKANKYFGRCRTREGKRETTIVNGITIQHDLEWRHKCGF